VKLAELVTVPAGVVTLRCPVVAPLGTVAEMLVALVTVNDAVTPLKRTDVAPVKFVPVMVTTVPTFPLVGDRPVIVAGTQNHAALVAVPLEVVTVMGPLVAEFGTAVAMELDDLTVNDAEVPLNFTAEAPLKLAPLIVTEVLTAPRRPPPMAITSATPGRRASAAQIEGRLREWTGAWCRSATPDSSSSSGARDRSRWSFSTGDRV
jgi:hypothetical protein